MKVLLSTTLLWKGYWNHSGDIVDLPDDVAMRYIQAGSAEPVQPQIETAALQTTPPKGRRDARIQTARI